jgi:hypothetical protein
MWQLKYLYKGSSLYNTHRLRISQKYSLLFDFKMWDFKRFLLLLELLIHRKSVCATFNIGDDSNIPRHTQFRIEVIEHVTDYTNVTLIGTNLGCGHDVYVTLLSTAKTKKCTGRSTACPLLETSVYEDKERCSYLCQCSWSCATNCQRQFFDCLLHLYHSRYVNFFNFFPQQIHYTTIHLKLLRT